jgi:hypothetical protein
VVDASALYVQWSKLIVSLLIHTYLVNVTGQDDQFVDNDLGKMGQLGWMSTRIDAKYSRIGISMIVSCTGIHPMVSVQDIGV